ncbi:MAG TPA: hypothetical protein VGI44_18490 [Acidimicrobiales bacterium]|jgi:hypothetical protein
MVSWLSAQSAWVLTAIFVPVALLVGFAARLVALAVIPPRERDQARAIATALMTAFAATFALLIALTVSNEATALSSAQNTVSAEAAQASVLAWTSTAPGVHSAPIQAALRSYLRATRANEWHNSAAASGSDPQTNQAIAALERTVRTQVDDRDLSTSTSNELLSSLDALSSGRRLRLAEASRGLPDFYAVTVLVTGLALIVNISVVGIRSGLRPAAVGASLTIVVGLSLALIFALATPWLGSITVSGSPLDAVIHDLTTGYFR